jgi:hypothetical protein
MRARLATFSLCAIGLLAFSIAAMALDHDNLDAGRPTRIEDAYPVAKGEVAVEGGALATRRGKTTSTTLSPRLLYGAFFNTQIELGGDIHPHASDSESSGNLRLGVLYNANTETLAMPALSARIEVARANGNKGGVDAAIGGVLTRSVGRWRTHLNLGYTRVGSPSPGVRGGRVAAAAGMSYPLGYPVRFRETVVADVFVEQSAGTGERPTGGAELGLRHQLSPRIVLDAGGGTEFAGRRPRASLFGGVGASAAF